MPEVFLADKIGDTLSHLHACEHAGNGCPGAPIARIEPVHFRRGLGLGKCSSSPIHENLRATLPAHPDLMTYLSCRSSLC